MDLFTEIRGGGGQPDFDAVFGGKPSPSSSSSRPAATSALRSGMGEMLVPVAASPLASSTDPALSSSPGQGLTSDVESSLVKAAENLSEASPPHDSSLSSHLPPPLPPSSSSPPSPPLPPLQQLI